MSFKRLKSLRFGVLGGAFLAAAACTPVQPPPTLSDMLEDRVLLDGIVLKCNADPQRSRNDPQCATARIAVARLAAQREAAEVAAHQADFERTREQLRQAQEERRNAQAAAQRVDAYSLPLVPVDPAPGAPGGSAPAAGTGPDHAGAAVLGDRGP